MTLLSGEQEKGKHENQKNNLELNAEYCIWKIKETMSR